MSHDHDHHGHGHHHGHGAHGHHHGAPSARGFALALVLNGGFVVVELVYGLLDSSMALVADALHNLGDVAGIALGWGAVRLARRRPTAQRTYGWRKATVLAALANAMLLLLTVGAVAWEATHRLWAPQPVPGLTLVVVAAIGVVINGASALAFMRDREHDVNRRAAYLHLLADAGVSLGVVAAGATMMTTRWWWLDPATGLVVSVVILATTWSLLREALAQAMDAVPRHVDAGAVRHHLEHFPGVQEVHDLHIWPLGTTEVALTVHLVIPAGKQDPSLLARLSTELREEFGIGHSTIQVETPEVRDDCARSVSGCE